MDDSITSFLEKQTCASLCCVDEEGKPYSFICYYSFNSEEGLLYFKSSAKSHHSEILKTNSWISGTILPDKSNILVVKGVQLEGIILGEEDPLTRGCTTNYYKRHPMAIAMPGEIRTIQINDIKMTDSSKGFGKKISWNRNQLMEAVI